MQTMFDAYLTGRMARDRYRELLCQAEEERRTREEELQRWAAKPLEEKVREALERWLMLEKTLNRRPTEEQIAAKREELRNYYSNPN